jgi:plastocyanin
MGGGTRRTVAVLLVAGAGIVGGPAALATQATAAPAVTGAVSVVPMGGTCTSLFCFKPPFVKVVNNSTVTWTNRSGVTHTITRCTPANCSGHGGGTGTDAGFGTTALPANQHYAFKFDAPGTYVYYCAIHGYAVMHGTVSVH